MKRLLKWVQFIALTASLPSLAMAADIVDQYAPTNNAAMASFIQTDLAQSFQQAASDISGAGIFLLPDVGSTDTVTITVWDQLPNVSGARAVATGSTSGTAGTWVDVFWSPVTINANSTYYLVFTGNTTLGIAGDTSNQYGRGQVFANAGFNPFENYDYTFRTYASTSPLPIPEPATFALMLGGILFVGARRFSGRSKV